MTRTLLLVLASAFLISSCKKDLGDRLISEWRLNAAYKKELFGRDYFQTGYESGIFTFYESGTAAYASNTDTLSDFWEADQYNLQHYNSSSGEWETRVLKYLRIYLANFQTNKTLDWRFDEFNFRNNWKCLQAIDYGLGRDRYYEFVKP